MGLHAGQVTAGVPRTQHVLPQPELTAPRGVPAEERCLAALKAGMMQGRNPAVCGPEVLCAVRIALCFLGCAAWGPLLAFMVSVGSPALLNDFGSITFFSFFFFLR